MQFTAEFVGSNYGAFASDHRVLVEASMRYAKAVGLDQVSCISNHYRETQEFGGVVRWLRAAVGVPEGALSPIPRAALEEAKPRSTVAGFWIGSLWTSSRGQIGLTMTPMGFSDTTCT